MTLFPRTKRYIGDALRGVRRAPVEVIATLCTAVSFSVSMEIGDESMQGFIEIAIACFLLFVSAWTGTLLHALGAWNATRRWTVTLVGAAAVAAYAIQLLDFTRESEAWRAAMLVSAAILWLVALPAFGGDRKSAVERMRRVDSRVTLRVVGALLYGVALFAGLALALRAIDVLFELSLRSELYGHVWSGIFFVLVPWIVIGGLDDYVRSPEENAVARVAHRIATFLVPPLLALYYVILYAYVIRIGVTGEIPKNLVSPMVLAAGALAALAIVVFDPRPGATALARALRIAPPLFLPLAPLGMWAIFVRIGQYGWTEFRILRLAVIGAMAVLALLATLQLVRRRAFMLHVVPLVLAIVLVLGAFGPWSALAVSRRSQQARLVSALTELEIPLNDSTYAVDTARVRTVPAARYEQVRSAAQYLAAHFGADALPPVLRGYARGESLRWTDYAAVVGLMPDSPRDIAARAPAGGSLPVNVPIELEGAIAYRVSWMRVQGPDGRPISMGATPSEAASIAFRDSTGIAVHVADRLLFAELAPVVHLLRARSATAPGNGLPVAQSVLALTDSAGIPQGQLLLTELWTDTDSAGTRIGRLEGIVLLRRR